MASEYKLIATTVDVYMAIYSQHAADLIPFRTISQPCGSQHGDPEQGRMYTEWGFRGADYPSMVLDCTWRHDPEQPGVRNNEKRDYFICVARSRE